MWSFHGNQKGTGSRLEKQEVEEKRMRERTLSKLVDIDGWNGTRRQLQQDCNETNQHQVN